MMKTSVVANQKGGIGKTAISTHLAHYARERRLRTAFIDLDPQANATDTLSEYACQVTASQLFEEGTDLKELLKEVVEKGEGLVVIGADDLLANMEKKPLKDVAAHFKRSINTLGELGFDLCLIDTPPTIGNALAAALLAANFVLCPIEPDRFAMKGIKKMHATITNLRRFNPGLQFLGLVPNRVDARVPQHLENLTLLRDSYPNLVTPMTIGQRSSIAVAMSEGVPVWKIKKTAARVAKQEIRSLAQHVFAKMEIL